MPRLHVPLQSTQPTQCQHGRTSHQRWIDRSICLRDAFAQQNNPTTPGERGLRSEESQRSQRVGAHGIQHVPLLRGLHTRLQNPPLLLRERVSLWCRPCRQTRQTQKKLVYFFPRSLIKPHGGLLRARSARRRDRCAADRDDDRIPMGHRHLMVHRRALHRPRPRAHRHDRGRPRRARRRGLHHHARRRRGDRGHAPMPWAGRRTCLGLGALRPSSREPHTGG